MPYYPISLDLKDKVALVVGGGSVARRKIETLLEYGARIVVVSPEADDEVGRLARLGKIELRLKPYERSDAEGVAIIIAATDDREINIQVSADAKDRNVPVNVVDDPELCTFIVPATVKQRDLTISISTAGKSPALARQIREQIEAMFGPEYGEMVDILGEMRELAKEQIDSQPAREMCFRKIMDSNILDLLKSDKKEEARAVAMGLLRLASSKRG